ncbi:hypothetical protein BKA70DRAFT_599944 [Coprinopsis sp. MPI-PUGE-AT-0042]|nr:hypothetical protein BKA70DRAFT_599944 [Coprinopsis sp. MPI-PUGE-AT-0042]
MTCDHKRQASHCLPPVAMLEPHFFYCRADGCHYAYDPSSAAALSRPTIASATVGHLLHVSDLDVVAVRQGLIQHHMACRAAILSILEGPLNFQDIHVMAPGAPATRVWMGIWRDFVSAQRLTGAYASHGAGNAERSQDDFSVSSSLAIQKSTRT